MTRPSLFYLSGKTSITVLSLLMAFSMTSGVTVLEDLEHSKCDTRYRYNKTECWHYEDENIAVYATQGDRKNMEDRILFEKNIAGSGVSVYAVFDGHAGDKAVKFVTENFINVLKKIIMEVKSFSFDESEKIYLKIDYKTILREALTTIEKKLLEEMTKISDESGTTATVAIIDENEKVVFVANIGDSRAIMGDENGKAYRLSIDHKPNNLKERKRIQDAGGRVWYDSGFRIDTLSVSRALGDLSIKHKNHVIADPDTFIFDLSRYSPKLLVLTSDGIVDYIPDEATIALAKSRLESEVLYFGAREIATLAYERGSRDNITVLIVKMLK